MERLYILERYVPGLDETAVRLTGAAIAGAAAELRAEGDRIRWLGSVGLPGEDTDCALFLAASAALVGRAAERAGLTYERIIEAIAVRPGFLGREGSPPKQGARPALG